MVRPEPIPLGPTRARASKLWSNGKVDPDSGVHLALMCAVWFGVFCSVLIRSATLWESPWQVAVMLSRGLNPRNSMQPWEPWW